MLRSLFRTGTLRLALAFGAAVTLATATASASPVLVRDGNGGDVFNGNGLGTPPILDITVSGSSLRVYAGPFALQYSTDSGTSWTNFLTYCLEPDELLGISGSQPAAGDLVPSLATTAEYGARASEIARLYRTYFADSLTSATKAAAFQVAMWEVAYDTGKNLGAGSFRLQTTGAVATQAAAYLTNWVSSGDVGVILRTGNQDLVVDLPPPARTTAPAAVPEPGSLALLGVGLAMLAGVRRRTRRG